jgi:hypothetical protein
MSRSFRPIRVLALVLFALAQLALAVPSVFAQGLYYKEIRKDDRIYVFNVAANADRFEKTGEVGVSITKPGAGPNGETVVGDNERALQLFFFKHGISEPVPDPPPPPPPAPPYRFSGLMFGDYYWFAQNHLSAWEDQHGLWFRRLYFTYDHTFSPKISTRFRLEMNSNGKLAGGVLAPYVKDAYLRWNAFKRQTLTLGIQPSLTFEYSEAIWGLRHIEKTPLDLYRMDSSRDTGVTLSGPMNETQTLKYAFQYGNESGNNAETDKFKAYRFATRYETNPGFTAEVMLAQFEREKDADRTTAQIFGGYRAKKGRAGLQYSFQKRRAATGTTAADVDLDVISGFGVYDLKPQKASIFARIDRFADPCADCSGIDYLPIDTKEAFTLTIVGAEYYIHPSVRFSPNVQWVKYSTPSGSAAVKPKDDAVVRLTFFWTW